MKDSYPIKTSGHAPSPSLHDQVTGLRRKLQFLREHDSSHEEAAAAIAPIRFASTLRPKPWRRRQLGDGTPNTTAAVLIVWLIYLTLGGAAVALVLHFAAKR